MSTTLIFGSIISLFATTLASNGFWEWLRTIKKSKRRTPEQEMHLALGRDRLMNLCKEYESLGYIPADEYENFIQMGNAYIKMGGNSTIKKRFKACEKLELKDE